MKKLYMVLLLTLAMTAFTACGKYSQNEKCFFCNSSESKTRYDKERSEKFFEDVYICEKCDKELSVAK